MTEIIDEKITDKQIIDALVERLYFALNHWKYSGGLVFNRETGESQTPMHYFADGLAMAGIKLDPDDINALCLPAKDKRKYFTDKKKPNATEGSGQ